MTDQPRGDESQDNVGTGAEISTENEATAIFYDGSDGVPPSGATPKKRREREERKRETDLSLS